MDTERAETELADFAHQRSPYDTHWMDDRIKLFLARNIVIARTEPADGHVTEAAMLATAGSGPETATASVHANPEWIRNKALNLLNLADYIEHRDTILAAKEAKAKVARDKRRDELASEFTAVNSYSGQLPYTQNLINRIIELEDAAK